MLATNLFFWTWTGAPVHPPPPVPPVAGRGSGKLRPEVDYTPLTDEQWQAREDALRANLPPVATPETQLEKRLRYAQQLQQFQQRHAQLTALRASLDGALAQLRQAATPDDILRIASTVKQLRTQTGELDNQHRAHLARLKSMRFQLLN